MFVAGTFIGVRGGVGGTGEALCVEWTVAGIARMMTWNGGARGATAVSFLFVMMWWAGNQAERLIQIIGVGTHWNI